MFWWEDKPCFVIKRWTRKESSEENGFVLTVTFTVHKRLRWMANVFDSLCRLYICGVVDSINEGLDGMKCLRKGGRRVYDTADNTVKKFIILSSGNSVWDCGFFLASRLVDRPGNGYADIFSHMMCMDRIVADDILLALLLCSRNTAC